MFDLGDVIPLSVQIKDAAGGLADGGAVTVTITQPDSTVDGPHTVASTTTGVYNYDFVPAQAGRHTVRWISTGANASSYADIFDVAEPSRAIISLSDAKKHLRFPDDYTVDDEELRLFIESATALIEHEVGPVVPATHVEIVEATETIVLAKAPVLDVVSVVPTFTVPGGLDFGLPTYTLEATTGMLRQQPGCFSSWGFDYGPAPQVTPWLPYGLRLTVTYRAGRAAVPAPLQAAARIVVENLWESRRIAGSQSPGGDEVQQYGREVIPSRAIELMAPYRRSPMVA